MRKVAYFETETKKATALCCAWHKRQTWNMFVKVILILYQFIILFLWRNFLSIEDSNRKRTPIDYPILIFLWYILLPVEDSHRMRGPQLTT